MARIIGATRLAGGVFSRVWLTVDELMKGAALEFVMGKSPNPGWGTAAGEAPPSYEPDSVTQ